MNKAGMEVFNQYANGKMKMEEAMEELHPPPMLKDRVRNATRGIAWWSAVLSIWFFFRACTAHASPATDAIKACAPYRTEIADAAELAGVPVALLTALVFAESTCRADAVNKRTGAIGLTQLLSTGAGAGYTREELLDPFTNATVGAKHLKYWRRRCGDWRGAVEIFGARKNCKVRSEQGAKIVALWKAIRLQEVKS